MMERRGSERVDQREFEDFKRFSSIMDFTYGEHMMMVQVWEHCMQVVVYYYYWQLR
jgi:hypothetical protein